MNSIRQHIIRREIVELVVTGTEADGFALQHAVAELCRDWLTPALDAAFSRVVPSDEHWSFERLDVDVGCFTLETLESDFVAAVATAVEKQINERSTWPVGFASETGRAMQRRTDGQSIHEALLDFLATGALPWWFHLPAGQTFEQVLIESWRETGPPAALSPALIDLIGAPVARLRLVRQFSTQLIEELLASQPFPVAQAVRDFRAHVDLREAVEEPSHDPSRSSIDRQWQAVFAVLASRQPVTVERLVDEWTRAASPDAASPGERALRPGATTLTGSAGPVASSEVARPAENADGGRHVAPRAAAMPGALEMSARPIDLDEGVFIDCAGVVLLHPFLPTLFERIGVAAGDKLLAPDRALALLHFLATGATRAPEHALVLPKLMCGLPPDALADAPVELTEAETTEAEQMLKAVIGHWGALSDTSPDALRGTFLTRPGKLSMRGDDDLLQVEPQSFDVLLDQLPWGIGTILLPWMTRFLWVEWRI
ncbi:hypothetical protein DID96_25445 [Burkholderia sp. Bp8963]|uniref:contractile injection system tape measure protein n=1 Tax=Burkholderia sp. Bp8963 TaxID=2184547 RepID=UPI000FAB255F|nr:contractile injection system tape measure protein [Burkholderia sp. Bp8963]RQS65774.1 hypothetical protein DID96_25445 [Burkholderia sp. Bp8963]